MKKIALSVASLVAVASLHAGTDGVNTKLKHGADADSVTTNNEISVNHISDMFQQGKVSGQIRMFYIDREYQGGSGSKTHRDTTALGGHLKFETAKLSGFYAGAAFYTTNDLGINQHGTQDPSLLGTNLDSYSILGEGYIGYSFSKTDVKLGYQRYDTPMIGSDDARMLPNTFRAYKFVNKDIDNLQIQISHVDQIAYGSFSNIYNSGGILAMTSGYSGKKVNNPITGDYYNLGYAVSNKNTAGITNIQAKYTAKNFHIMISDDYAWNLYNTLYADAGTSWNCLLNNDIHPFVQAQLIKQNSVGSKYLKYSDAVAGGSGEVDSLYWAAKVGAKYVGFTAYIAYSQTSKNNVGDDAYKNAIVSQFGGMPAFTQGMVTRHQFLAGTKASKVAAAYSFRNHGINLSSAVYYVSFDMDANSGYGIDRIASESGFDIKYYPKMLKNKLQLRFRGNFPRKFAEGTAGSDTGWNEYRLIANYNF